MKKLKDIICNGEDLSKGLRENDEMHQNYKLYTSMERALGILISGYLYLSNGNSWNDNADKTLMHVKKAYAMCFSCSTRENIAMWMLYGADHGMKGAMINFYPSVLKELLKTDVIDLGCFDEHHQYRTKHTLYKKNKDFAIFLSDVVYTDFCGDRKVKLTVGDEHEIADIDILDNKDVFYKNYAWAYEKECRLIVRTAERWKSIAEREDLVFIRIKIPANMMRKVNESRLIRSPVYNGDVAVGELSSLIDDVNWVL